MTTSFKSLLQGAAKNYPSIFLKEGEYLFRQNQVAESIYVVVSGKVYAVLEEQGEADKIVAEIGLGETVGEMSLITGNFRSTSVIAARDSELRCISKSDFERTLLENPQVLFELTRLISLRLDKTTKLQKIELKPKNIAVAPAGVDSNAYIDYARVLADVLSKRGRVIVLNEERIRSIFAQLDLSEGNEESLDRNSELIQWLNNVEDQNDFIISVTNQNVDWWTRRCLRSADRIYLFGKIDGNSNLNDLESYMWREKLLNDFRCAELILQHPRGSKTSEGSLRWLTSRQVLRHHHCEEGNRSHVERQVRFLVGESTGLVLGGGGAKGLAHIGVIRAMREAKIPIDMIGGTSAGSIVAGLHALGLEPQEQVESFKRFAKNYKLKKYTFPWLSLFDVAGIDKAYSEFFGNHQIEDLFTRFFCVSCNLNTAQKVVHEKGFLREAIRASTAIPGIYAPVLFEHSLLIDGGIMDNVPAREMKQRGANTVIAVDVATRNDLNVDASVGRLPSGWEMLVNRLHPRRRAAGIPNIIEILMRTLLLNSINRSAETTASASLSLRPPVEKISMLDFSKPEEAEKIGYDYAVPRLEAFMKKNDPAQLVA